MVLIKMLILFQQSACESLFGWIQNTSKKTFISVKFDTAKIYLLGRRFCGCEDSEAGL